MTTSALDPMTTGSLTRGAVKQAMAARPAKASRTADGIQIVPPTAPAAHLTLGEAATRIIEAAVVSVVGSADARPRPGQVAMLGDVIAAMNDDGHGQGLAEGPTGVGKSLVYLSAAAAAVVSRAERSVVSTESLALQSQIVDKDAPIVAAACQAVTGYAPKFAVLKGWSNYVCGTAALQAGNDVLTSMGRKGDGQIAALKKKVDKALADRGPLLAPDAREKTEVVAWALAQVEDADDERVTGDKNAYPGNMADGRTWEAVSVSSSDCLGAERCPLADQCLPRKARQRAAEADVIVTNHHLLAVQAANDIPVVIGSKNLGDFHHVFVDEGHGLPQIVRNQGAVEISARSVLAAARAVAKHLDDRESDTKRWLEDGEAIATYVGDDLRERARAITNREPVVRLKDGEEPLSAAAPALEAWVKAGQEIVKKAASRNSSPTAEIGLKRAKSRLDGLKNALDLVSVHKPGAARWVEVVTPHGRAADQTPYPVTRYTPVDVASMIRWSLWTREMTEDEKEACGFIETPSMPVGQEPTSPDGPAPRVPLTSIVLSATMPTGFGRQVGIKAALKKYPSPFDDAYGNSVLFVPRAVDAPDVDALGSPGWGGKVKFDTGKHRAWALGHILDLVEANGGSALVLAATASAGKEYADALSRAAAGRWKVMSQWDGVALRQQVASWKDDHSAVLVGTRSLMTGVDAAGETCTLVIVDRPPRAASNPVDDARVEALVANADMDKWSADRLVYVSDAGLLLEQAAGRLIRKISDEGMVAVLDPRLLKTGPFSYPEPTRRAYLDTLHRFQTKVSDPKTAHTWLRERRAR